MNFAGDILFLDLARETGWCEGPLRGPLRYGTVTLAPQGSPRAAILAGAFRFLVHRLSAFRPRILAWEGPLDPRQQPTTEASFRQGIGLCEVADMVAQMSGVYDTREVKVADLKYYWLGTRKMKRDPSKRAIREKLRALGYDPQTFDASDAIAGHRYIAAQIDPSLRTEPMGLFTQGDRNGANEDD